MDWNVKSIQKIVSYINLQLSLGNSMSYIEKQEFGVNPRVIHKRLCRLGYKKINNQYINIKTNTQNIKITTNLNDTNKLNVSDLLELQNLLNPLKKLINEKNQNNYNDKPIELKIEKSNKIKQRTMKFDEDVLKRWDTFAKNNCQYKNQDLISQALREFMKKYE